MEKKRLPISRRRSPSIFFVIFSRPKGVGVRKKTDKRASAIFKKKLGVGKRVDAFFFSRRLVACKAAHQKEKRRPTGVSKFCALKKISIAKKTACGDRNLARASATYFSKRMAVSGATGEARAFVVFFFIPIRRTRLAKYFFEREEKKREEKKAVRFQDFGKKNRGLLFFFNPSFLLHPLSSKDAAARL